MSRRLIIVLLAAITFLVAVSSMTLAADANRAAIVVDLGDGDVVTRCVPFSEPEITGFELLQRSGLDVVVEDQAAGALVCSISNIGCPADDCLCQCRGGGDCIYWSYWHLLNDNWSYSGGGSSIYRINDGDVDGWTWGPGSVTEAIPPPDLTFADICTSEVAPTDTPTPSITPTPLVVANPPTATISIAADVASATPRQTATITSTVAAAESNSQTPPASSAATTPSVVTPLPTSSINDVAPTVAFNAASPTVVVAVPAANSSIAQPIIAASPNSSDDTLAEGYPTEMANEQQNIAPSADQPETAPEETGNLSVTAITADLEAKTPDVIAVIGAGAEPPEEAVATTMTDAQAAEAVQVNWLPYAGLLVMILALGILAAVAKLRVVNKQDQL